LAQEKCIWLPTQSIKWLGYIWNTDIGKLFVSDERIDKTVAKIKVILQKVSTGKILIYVRTLASIVGQLISMYLVFGNIVRFHTRYMYYCIMGKASWDAPVKLTQFALNELFFWEKNCRILNKDGVLLSHESLDNRFDFEIFCDASDVGFGGFCCAELGTQLEQNEMSGNWIPSEEVQSSTWRELECVNRVVNNFVYTIENKKVKLNSDNKNVEHILKVGSKKQNLQKIAVDIHKVCNENNITLVTKWLPRADNIKADQLSRKIDHDDWGIRSNVFDLYNQKWGPYTVDRFATHYNTQCVRFNSPIWCPGTEAVDAFSQYWGRENNWLVPPPSLISRVLNKMKNDKAYGTLILPEWKSASFWPIVHSHIGFAHFIKDLCYLSEGKNIVKGTGKNGVFAEWPLKFKMLVIKIQF